MMYSFSEITNLLLSHGADLSDRFEGNTPLQYAMKAPYLGIVKELMSFGALHNSGLTPEEELECKNKLNELKTEYPNQLKIEYPGILEND